MLKVKYANEAVLPVLRYVWLLKTTGVSCVDKNVIMKLNLVSCDAQRPDRRAIAKCISEISSNLDGSSPNQLTDILLEGDAVDIEIEDKNASSAYRALRKLSII